MTLRALASLGAGLMLAFSLCSAHAFEPLPPPQPARGTVQAAFAPWNDVESLIIDVIDGARRQVLVQAYLLTSKKMTQALIRAHRRGIDVRVLMDAEQTDKVPASQALALTEGGVSVWLETGYQNAHNKVIVVDGTTAAPVLVTGSYNYTWAAAHKNAENVLVLRDDPELAARYVANWRRHQRDATPFRP
ncbi:MAG: phospholipase D family protein [Burkholderiaceae bacterium]